MTTFVQLVAPRKNTQDGAGWCLRFAQSFFGAPVAHPSAWAAWNAATFKHTPQEALPTGAAVLLWFSHYGTYSGVYANWGHVAIYVPGDAIYTSPAAGWGQGRYSSIAEIERIFNAKYVGWSEAINGLRVAAPAALEPNQRQAFPGGKENDVKRREQPTTKSKDLGDPIPAGVVGTFDGWIRGEAVSGNNVWFRGKSSRNWFWSGGFTSQSTAGLTDLNPVTPTPGANQRVVDATLPVNVRSAAKSDATLTGSFAAGTTVTVAGWVNGDTVQGIKVWYKVDKGYAWAGGFTSQSTAGIPDLNPVDPPKPDPEPEVPDFVNFEAFSPVVTAVEPAHTNNYEFGNFPAVQTDVVLHDYGTDGRDSFTGTKAWFKNPSANASAHFVVSGNNIVQMVSLDDRAYHAGPKGNGFIGIELDPAVGREPGDLLRESTIKSARKLLGALNEKYGVQLKLRKHTEFMSTSCGDDVTLADFVVPYKPEEPGDTEVGKLSKLIQQLIDLLKGIFKVG